MSLYRDEIPQEQRVGGEPDDDDMPDDAYGPWYCANGCGYEVAYHNDICGECACEDDGDIY
jgi:hypothetical protein